MTIQIKLPASAWMRLAAFAYMSYQAEGRGVVTIELEPDEFARDAANSRSFIALNRLPTANWPTVEAEGLAHLYNPDTELVLAIVKPEGGVRVGIVTDSRKPTPRQIVEQLSRGGPKELL